MAWIPLDQVKALMNSPTQNYLMGDVWAIQYVLGDPKSPEVHKQSRRFTDVRYGRNPGAGEGLGRFNQPPYIWHGVPEGWLVTHYMPAPKPPIGEDE